MGMAAILINRPWPFEQIFYPPLTEGSTWSLKKIGLGVKEVIQRCEQTDGDERRTASDHNSSSWVMLRWAKKKKRKKKQNTHFYMKSTYSSKVWLINIENEPKQ